MRARDPDATRDARVSAARWRPTTPRSIRCVSFYEQGRRDGDFETGIAAGDRAAARRSALPVSVRGRARRRRAGRRSTASATSSSRRACRSSSGAASPTTSCSPPRPPARCTSRRRSSGRCAACSPTRAPRALVENFAGQWLKLRELRAALPQDPDFDAQPARLPFGARRSCCSSSVIREDRSVLDLLDAQLHVPERATRAPLRHRRACAAATSAVSSCAEDSPRRRTARAR